MTEKEEYFARVRELQAQGLKDVKFFAVNTFGVSEDDIYAELNRIDKADDLPDVAVLGKYSPQPAA